MDENQQQVVAPHEVGETLLPLGTVARQVRQHLGEDALAHPVIGRMIAGGVEKGCRRAVEPSHFHIEPVAPLLAQRLGIRRQPHNLVAGIDDELRPRLQARDHPLDARMGLLVRRSRHTGATVAVERELMPPSLRPQRRDGDVFLPVNHFMLPLASGPVPSGKAIANDKAYARHGRAYLVSQR